MNDAKVIQMLSEVFGGEPKLDICEYNGQNYYVILSACRCNLCVNYNRNYGECYYENIILAAVAYGINRDHMSNEIEDTKQVLERGRGKRIIN